MDLKTLEYMEERASKVRKLVNRIDDLTKSAEEILGSECVKFISNNTGVYFYDYELVKDIQKHAIEAINREISRLEKELAEL